eukprot:scaffold3519_cov60-Cylindrotheca_fusiformis.AAC.1
MKKDPASGSAADDKAYFDGANKQKKGKAGSLLKRVEEEENKNNEERLQLSIVHDDTLTPPLGGVEAVEEVYRRGTNLP